MFLIAKIAMFIRTQLLVFNEFVLMNGGISVRMCTRDRMEWCMTVLFGLIVCIYVSAHQFALFFVVCVRHFCKQAILYLF